jgi:hypothetical protein
VRPVGDGWLAVAVQELWRGIKAVGPYHRSGLVIDLNLPEVLRIAQGLPERPVEQEGAVNISFDAIVERNPEAIVV